MNALLSGKGLIGLSLVILVGLVAVLSPLFIPEALSTKIDVTARLMPPSPDHFFGTDQLGRELFYRVLLGASTSLFIAFTAVALSILVGLPLGILSGYFAGWTDHILMRVVDTLLSFPAILLALAISSVLGPNLRNTILAIGIAFAPYLARIVRGETLKVCSLPYIEAIRSQGASNLRIITRHVLPNVMPPVIAQIRAGKALQPGKHMIQGIGAGFIPEILNLEVIDDVQHVTNEESFSWARRAAKEEGIMCGISSGAALCVADRIARNPENKGKTIVAVLPSAGERYLSTPLFSE